MSSFELDATARRNARRAAAACSRTDTAAMRAIETEWRGRPRFRRTADDSVYSIVEAMAAGPSRARRIADGIMLAAGLAAAAAIGWFAMGLADRLGDIAEQIASPAGVYDVLVTTPDGETFAPESGVSLADCHAFIRGHGFPPDVAASVECSRTH